MATDPVPDSNADQAQREQSFLSHLAELRDRLIRAILCVRFWFWC